MLYKFADVLKDLIEDKGLSLRKLATESGVSAVQYGKYLKGVYPKIFVAERIARYFNVSFDYLFGITENNTPRDYKDVDMSVFLDRYEEVRNKANITHWKLSQTTELSESALRHWEYGDIPTLESLIIIATNLSTSIDYLVGRI